MFITSVNRRSGSEQPMQNSSEKRFLDGLWVDNRPLGFAGGDINLYRFVGSDPIDNSDPSGLSIRGGTTTFLDNLGQKVSPDEQKILDALQQNQTFKDLIAYLQRCDLTYQFVVNSNLTGTVGGKSLSIPGETTIGRGASSRLSSTPASSTPAK